jgi:hypothetical protein
MRSMPTAATSAAGSLEVGGLGAARRSLASVPAACGGATLVSAPFTTSVLSQAERSHYRLFHSSPVDIGGHFATWEGPELVSVDARGTRLSPGSD